MRILGLLHLNSWYNIDMKTVDKQTTDLIAQRQQAMADAVASVQAEGLTPTDGATKRLSRYVSDEISSDQLYTSKP